jgi:hypothetical protein
MATLIMTMAMAIIPAISVPMAARTVKATMTDPPSRSGVLAGLLPADFPIAERTGVIKVADPRRTVSQLVDAVAVRWPTLVGT